jgi:hypothetical protein
MSQFILFFINFIGITMLLAVAASELVGEDLTFPNVLCIIIFIYSVYIHKINLNFENMDLNYNT